MPPRSERNSLLTDLSYEKLIIVSLFELQDNW